MCVKHVLFGNTKVMTKYILSKYVVQRAIRLCIMISINWLSENTCLEHSLFIIWNEYRVARIDYDSMDSLSASSGDC
jgi:hypothetical protein